MLLVPAAGRSFVTTGSAVLVMADIPFADTAMGIAVRMSVLTTCIAVLGRGFAISKSLEGHGTDQQNSNQQQREHLLHYCFHFVSNLLMKYKQGLKLCRYLRLPPFAYGLDPGCPCTDAIFIPAL